MSFYFFQEEVEIGFYLPVLINIISFGFRLNRENLELMREITDRAAQGRACGNLGNTHYLLGSFTQAIKYHQEVSVFDYKKFISYDIVCVGC